MKSLPTRLQQLLDKPLPGFTAQKKMAHAIRQTNIPVADSARKAAVLILLYEKFEEWYFPLIQRTTNEKDKHSGQVSLPGGKFENADRTLATTALREAEEELGINSNDVELIGQLTELYIPVSNFLVQPYIGYLSYEPSFTPEVSEVSEIIEAPFVIFQNDNSVQHKDMFFQSGYSIKQVPYFDIQNKVVWGATAMILSELREIHRSERRAMQASFEH